MSTCLVRVDDGLICRKPKAGEVIVKLPAHDYIRYVKEAELLPVPMCADHLALVEVGGWTLQPKVLFHWVPPDANQTRRP